MQTYPSHSSHQTPRSNWLRRLFARLIRFIHRASLMRPFHRRHTRTAAMQANRQAQQAQQAEVVLWRWLAGHTTWEEAQQAQQQAQAVAYQPYQPGQSGWPRRESTPPALLSRNTPYMPDTPEQRDEQATRLAHSFNVVAEEIDRRRAPSASGDRLFIATVLGSAGPGAANGEHDEQTYPPAIIAAHRTGSRWVVRINRRDPSQLACTCPSGKRPGGVCGHIGAVLLLLWG